MACDRVASVFCKQPPKEVYRSCRVPGGGQRAANLDVAILLSNAAAEHLASVPERKLKNAVLLAVLRFDGAMLEVAIDMPNGTQTVVPFRDDAILRGYALDDAAGVLHITLRPGALPLSSSFGGACIVLVVHIVACKETVVSTPFRVASLMPLPVCLVPTEHTDCQEQCSSTPKAAKSTKLAMRRKGRTTVQAAVPPSLPILATMPMPTSASPIQSFCPAMASVLSAAPSFGSGSHLGPHLGSGLGSHLGFDANGDGGNGGEDCGSEMEHFGFTLDDLAGFGPSDFK